jgi:hypothetical protein
MKIVNRQPLILVLAAFLLCAVRPAYAQPSPADVANFQTNLQSLTNFLSQNSSGNGYLRRAGNRDPVTSRSAGAGPS